MLVTHFCPPGSGSSSRDLIEYGSTTLPFSRLESCRIHYSFYSIIMSIYWPQQQIGGDLFGNRSLNTVIINFKLYSKGANGVLPYRLLNEITYDLFLTGWNEINYVYSVSSSLCSRLCLATRSVADPGCLSLIPDPDCDPSRIPDPTKPTKEEGEKISWLSFYFVGKNFTKLFYVWTRKLSEIWVWDPRSEIRNPKPGSEIPGTGKSLSWIQRIKKAPDHESGSATLATKRSIFCCVFLTHDWFIIFRMGHEKPTEEALSTANSEASELKEKGNEAYKNDNLDDALVFYTQGNYFCNRFDSLWSLDANSNLDY